MAAANELTAGNQAMDLSMSRSIKPASKPMQTDNNKGSAGSALVTSTEDDSQATTRSPSVLSSTATSGYIKRKQHGLIASSTIKKRQVNIFKKHKLKYQYLNKRNISKHTSDSGQFGSSSMQGSSSTSNSKRSTTNNSTCSMYMTSSSPSSGTSDSPVNVLNSKHDARSKVMTNTDNAQDPTMRMMLQHSVPLVVMMQGQFQTGQPGNNLSYSDTTLFKCNMCSMFANTLSDVLNHVNVNHSNVYYCFCCNKFHGSQAEFEKHKSICSTAHQAFRQIVGSHYQNQNKNQSGSQEHALNLSVAGNVAMRAAQMIHNKKGRQKKLKKIQKCTYCKKAFFGQFYLQRHLRSHTGEKLCHCNICGKGFAEWRNLRNHMNRFHNGSQSSESGAPSKSVSPNITSDSDQVSSRSPRARPNTNTSGTMSRRESDQSVSVTATSDQSIPRSQSLPHTRLSMEFSHPAELLSAWASNACSSSIVPSANCNNSDQKSEPCSPDDVTPSTAASDVGNIPSENQSEKPCTSIAGSDAKPAAANLGTTSSRLQLSNSESMERSLNPVCGDNGDKFYQCTMCSKTFRTKFAMQRHLDFHADKRPFQCEQCDYKAKTKPQLKVHIMRHSGEKGFHCNICNYACVTHSDLNRHCKSRSHLFRVSVLEHKEGDGSANNIIQQLGSLPVTSADTPGISTLALSADK